MRPIIKAYPPPPSPKKAKVKVEKKFDDRAKRMHSIIDAFSHVSKRVCPSVRPSVRPSVCPDVRPCARPSLSLLAQNENIEKKTI